MFSLLVILFYLFVDVTCYIEVESNRGQLSSYRLLKHITCICPIVYTYLRYPNS